MLTALKNQAEDISRKEQNQIVFFLKWEEKISTCSQHSEDVCVLQDTTVFQIPL